MPGVVKVVVKKNFVGVVAEKPWQAMQAAQQAEGDVDARRRGLPPQREFYDYLRKQPSRDAFVVNSRDVDETLAKAATVVKATYLHPYQMHGSMGTSCAVADVQGDKATIWSPTQSAYPTRSGVGDAARRAGRQRPRHLHARLGLLRHQRRRHGVVRRGAAVAGGRQAGARAALAQGRDGVGELRASRT